MLTLAAPSQILIDGDGEDFLTLQLFSQSSFVGLFEPVLLLPDLAWPSHLSDEGQPLEGDHEKHL